MATVCICDSQYLGFGGPWVSDVSALVKIIVKISSTKPHCQTVRPRELTFLENLSCVVYHMSPVTCHMSHSFSFDKVVKLAGGGSVINEVTPSSFCNGPGCRLKAMAVAPPIQDVSNYFTNKQEKTCLE